MGAEIFISYRRDDALPMVGRLDEALAVRFGRQRVYRDVTQTPAGAVWNEVIETNARSAAVMVVVIGPR